jgi:hypothetical protein
MSGGGLGRNDPCFCGSGKKYKKCCYPRTLPDFSKPNAGIPTPFEENEALYRALSRQEAQPPQDRNMTIDKVDVGRTRLTCAPLPPYGDNVALPGTLAPPTPSQIEAKYREIQEGNPEGVTEVVVTYTCPEMFGFAEVRAVFDADDHLRLVDGRPVSVLDLFRGMQVVMDNGSIGTIVGNPERRYEIPVPPLPSENGLWTSRVVGRAKHTAHEVVEFRWGGQMVRVTPGHAVWSADRRGWVGAHELRPGELIRVAGNKVAPVEGMRRVPGLIEVFGIEVEYFHNYFVGGGPNAMLVHNGPGDCIPKPVLADHEAAGGHLIARHVGKTDAELAARLAAERRISGSSTFTDLAAADRGVGETVAANEAAIRSWLSGSSSRTVVEHTLPSPVGRTLTRGASAPVDSSSVRLVLERDASMPGGFRVITGFPK